MQVEALACAIPMHARTRAHLDLGGDQVSVRCAVRDGQAHADKVGLCTARGLLRRRLQLQRLDDVIQRAPPPHIPT
jgi:hypothetical protein